MFDPKGALQLYLDKIETRRGLAPIARQMFLALPYQIEEFDIYRDIVSEGGRTDRCCLMITGCVSRYKTLVSGGRQINSFHFAGDMVDLQSSLVVIADHGIRTHSPCTVARIECRHIIELAAEFPEWSRAFWFDTLVDAAIFREWTLNVGRRSAVERVAHLLLEIVHRLVSIGQSDGTKFYMPVTQADLSDAVGLSPVHTNRSLQHLRETGLIRTHGRNFVIEDGKGLWKLAGFDPAYLHPEGPRY